MSFKAIVVDKDDKDFSIQLRQLEVRDLPAGEVLIQVKYSGVNYKDSLASIPNGNIVKDYPMVPGIDLAGIVVSSQHPDFSKGDEVIATSYEIGVSRYGGYSEYAQLPAQWVLPLPKGLTLKKAMTIGTAGLTAALSILKLEQNGLTENSGKVLVTGATGGVGSFAVALLANRGYEVVASTGKKNERDYLMNLGASSVITREEVYDGKISALSKQKWIAAVDPVGGEPLASLLSQIQYGGAVAVSGLTAGTNLPTTVFPFILRGVSLLGVDSVFCPMEMRKEAWELLAEESDKLPFDQFIFQEVSLSEVEHVLPLLLKGETRGRVLVHI
ncbi:acryloyl-CoA reductase [Cytobacillus sp. FSL W7-1323]|uniref:acrylyl-CoA reductase family protein n=1 Tax=Cytobacillus sp. FSL W7-1323 TaxID=2921700 RepID=UPI0031580C25